MALSVFLDLKMFCFRLKLENFNNFLDILAARSEDLLANGKCLSISAIQRLGGRGQHRSNN